MYSTLKKPQYKTLSEQLKIERRKKAIKNAWNKYIKPLCIAVIVFPFLYILLVGAMLVLQSEAEYKHLDYPQSELTR